MIPHKMNNYIKKVLTDLIKTADKNRYEIIIKINDNRIEKSIIFLKSSEMIYNIRTWLNKEKDNYNIHKIYYKIGMDELTMVVFKVGEELWELPLIFNSYTSDNSLNDLNDVNELSFWFNTYIAKRIL